MPGMRINRFALALTALNLLATLAFWSQLQVACAQAVPDLVRAKGLEIVDDRGIVRAQILVQATTSVLSQANASPQNVLALLA